MHAHMGAKNLVMTWYDGGCNYDEEDKLQCSNEKEKSHTLN